MAVSIKTEALRTLTGQVETALLVIHDFRQMARNANTGQAGGLTAVQTLQAISNELAAGTQAALSSGTTPTYPNSQDKIFKVQFNPSELTLNATSYPVNKVNTANGQSRTMTVEDPSLFLWVNLYFDDMQTTDAFMGEKFNTLVSAQGVANVANSIMSAMGKNKHTVQPQVEALVAALRNPYTRTISFRWANFAFIGQLNNVRAEYTMFSTSGRPIRAKVMLQIRHELDPRMLNQWYNDYASAFGTGTSSMSSVTQKMGNILNINL